MKKRASFADFRSRLCTVLLPLCVLMFGCGNDADGSEPAFRRLVDQAIAIVGRRRCLVWATVVRDGAARTAFNEVLEDARSDHANVRLVEWASLVGDDRGLLAGDLVHGTPEGYARRAEATADAIRDCPAA